MRSMMRTRIAKPIAIAVLLLGIAVPVQAQASSERQAIPLDIHARSATRVRLEARLAELQQQALTAENSDAVDALRLTIQALGYRLREGDIHQGDVIALAVAGEVAWTDNFTITPSRTLLLETIDPIPVGNLLYSELETHLTTEIGRYLRQPRVQAEALKRIAVLGGIGAPGFYSVSGSMVVADLLMEAGGPSGTAEMDKAEFRRLGKDVGFDGGPIAFQAYSLDQLGVRSGDELHVPVQSRESFWRNLQIFVLSITSVTFALTRIF